MDQTPTLRRDHARSFKEILDAAEAASAPTDIIIERGKTHGNFGDNARVSQALKRTFRGELGWELLTDTEREAMDMIALKFSRLLSGKALELQHWEDVVGYARLAESLCKHTPDV